LEEIVASFSARIEKRVDRLHDRAHHQAEQWHYDYERDRVMELLKHFELCFLTNVPVPDEVKVT